MTKEELKQHCEKQVKMCEEWAKGNDREPSGKIYEEHKLILDLINALEQPTSDDCVSRADLLKMYENRFIELQKVHQKDKQLGVNWCINTLKEMPPVTPAHCIAAVRFSKEDLREICNERIEIACEHGTCKDCKHWKDSDGVYRRGINAESKCSINNSRVFDGTFYCADFEKRGNENGSN